MNAVLIAAVLFGNVEMEYLRFGNGERNLVIIPGVSVQSVMNYGEAIAESYKLLTEEFTVYVLDRRKDMPEEYSVEAMARDSAGAIKALGLERVSIFGASQGGMIAMKIAIEQPDLVEKLIVGSSSGRITQEQYGAVERWAELARAGKAEELYLSFGERVYPPSVFEQSRKLLVEAAKTVTPEDLRRFAVMTEGMKGFDVMGDLRKIECPVLVIGSKDDGVLGGRASEELAEKLGCEVFMYEGYGHAVYDLAPDYRERMLKFLTK